VARQRVAARRFSLALAAALSVAAVLLPVCPTAAWAQGLNDPGHPRFNAPVTILQLNDVYSTVPVDGLGGLARVATLKRQFAEAGLRPLLMLAGDFLSSSVASTVFKGEQMIAALNAAGLDVATLGNHEFDFGLDVLLQRMSEAKFQWVVSNVIDTQTGRPVGNAVPYVVRSFGTIRVGVLGLCLSVEELMRDKLERLRVIDPATAAATYLPILKAEGADVIVALTHLTYEEDRALAARFPEIDVIVGGHEHFPIAGMSGRTLISKSGSDAKAVARIDVARTASGFERFYELLPMTAAIDDDPATAAVVSEYERKLGGELDKPVATSRTALDGTALRLRSSETNLGNLVADAVRAAVESDVAIVNSGGIRGDRVHAAGPITRRQVVEVHPFGNTICKLEAPGRAILAALTHGVSRLPVASGQFPQVSGLRMRVVAAAAPADRVRDVTIGGKPLELDRIYTLAVPDFLVLGGDGYDMLAGLGALIAPDLGPLMATALESYIGGREFEAAVDGRITIVR
jgi:5'-nucleotidase